jgi:ABC-type taurine transport system substrate-binding protein
MANGAGKPKPAFFVTVLVVVAGLIGFAFYRWNAGKKADTGQQGSSSKIDMGAIKQQAGGSGATGSGGGSGIGSGAQGQAENPDPNSITTVKEYSFESAQRLADVPGTADYAALGKPRTVKFAVNVWAGWAPIIWANQGSKAKKVWKDAKGNDFLVDLVLADNPVDMGNTFAAGKVHIGWATVDMLPLVVNRFKRDPRSAPRVFQQIDWSNGGDGIVAREAIKNVADLRGKNVVLAQNSPSHYFLLNMLLNGGVQPSEVHMDFTKDAFQAAAAFNQDKKYAAVVSWSPDIYNLTKTGMGNRMLVSTQTANRLIADVWFARADFARDNPDIIEGLVRGIFDADEDLKSDQNKQAVGKLMDDFYSLPAGTGLNMLGDAHWTNYAENRDFFLNQNNPTNFERTYNTAFLLYRAIRSVDEKLPFDQLMDFSVIKKLGSDPKLAAQKNEYEFKFTPTTSLDVNVESAVLTKTVTINFFPNSNDIYKKVPAKSGTGELFYDPNVENTVEEIAKLAGQFGAARIQIAGHTDASMRGVAEENLVRELSLRRANAVKEALVNKFHMDPNQFIVAGYGWDKPADPKDPENHAKNRRVEIKVVPAEAQ